MKVIILTQYFPPETGAPQNRLFAIAHGMVESGIDVTVVTGMPNYPEMRIHDGYRGTLFMSQNMDGVKVLRSWLYTSKNKRIHWRLLNYFTFMVSGFVHGLIRAPQADVVITESPPLFLGASGLLLAKLKGASHVFNVSDLWPESAVQLGIIGDGLALRMAERLEMLCYRKSAMVLGQTRGIVQDISGRVEVPVKWVPNGADLNAIVDIRSDETLLARFGIDRGIPYFVYAGVLGHAQGLETILEAATLLQDSKRSCHLVLIGSGPEEAMLTESVEKRGLGNIHMLGRLERKEVLAIIKTSVASIVPLKRNDLFLGAIPSKIFECLAMGKPIILGVNGEAKTLFIDDATCGLHFEPESAEGLVASITNYLNEPELAIEHGSTGAKYVREQFDRRIITDKLIVELRKLRS